MLLPMTFNRNGSDILGSVLTWHSYTPESRSWGNLICNVQLSDLSGRITWNLWSDVYVNIPAVKMCRSRLRIHETWNKNIDTVIIFNLHTLMPSNSKAVFHFCVNLKKHVIKEAYRQQRTKKRAENKLDWWD
jgi:hypothetical protein